MKLAQLLVRLLQNLGCFIKEETIFQLDAMNFNFIVLVGRRVD